MKTKIILLTALFINLLIVNSKAQGVGEKAPDFMLSSTTGESFKLADQSDKVVFIFFFGNTCAHCLANGPNTQTDIYEQFKDNSAFVAIGIDTWDGAASKVESYQASTGIEYPLFLNGSGVQSDFNTTYDRIIVIDQNGIIRYKATANADKTVTAEAKKVITELLNTTGIFGNSTKDHFEVRYSNNEQNLLFNNPFEGSNNVNIKIINLTGKVVQEQNITLSESNSIGLNNINSGIYIIAINDKKTLYTARFKK